MKVITSKSDEINIDDVNEKMFLCCKLIDDEWYELVTVKNKHTHKYQWRCTNGTFLTHWGKSLNNFKETISNMCIKELHAFDTWVERAEFLIDKKRG